MSSAQPNRTPDEVARFRTAGLVSPEPTLRKLLLETLADRLEVFECVNPAAYPAAGDLIERNPDLCFIDVGSNTPLAIALIREVKDAGTPVIAVSKTNESELILLAMRSGADEFLSVPLGKDTLQSALNRLSEKQRAPVPKIRTGKIWVTMPAKPNYGSTTVACNLAVRLNKVQARRVLLVDMDPLMGSISFLLGLRSRFSIVEAIGDAAHMDSDLWKKLVVKHDGVDILPGPDFPRRDDFDCDLVPPLFHFLRNNYAISIIDSPGPVSAWQLKLASEADELLLITTNELAAIHSSKRALQHLETAGVPRSRLRLIVNRYLKENGLSRNAIETGLKLDVFQILPNDYEAVQRAILEGKTVGANSRLSGALDELCAHMTGFTRARKSWLPAMPKVFGKKSDAA